MKFFSSTLIASLLLNGIAVPVELRAAEDAAQACTTDGFTPSAATPEAITTACGSGVYARNCKTTRENLLEWSKEYKSLAEQACQKRSESLKQMEELNQSSAYAEMKTKAEQGIADISKLIEANRKIRAAIPKQSEQNVQALEKLSATQPTAAQLKASVSRIRGTWGRAKSRPEILESTSEGVKESDKASVSGISDPKNKADAKAQFDTLSQSQEFVRALMLEEKKNKDAISKLTDAKNNAVKNAKNTQTAENPNSKSNESGFSPMSLLPLAAPLAGLLMQQKQQASGLSEPTTPTMDPYANQPPAALAGTSLDPKTNQSPSATPIGNSKGPDAEMHMPTESYAGGSGAVQPFEGDISNGNNEGKSSNAVGAGSYSANSGGGASDSSGSSTSPGKAERKPANAAAGASEEGLIGSGGGGGFAASSSTDTAAEAEGGMKDMLHDMESTLEDVPTGLFAESDHANSADGIAPESSESLFPRVRACYVRNLKKGFVLNGLGEKLPDSDSH